ncbi:hypothetical protein [Paludisphaera rhizosphaerae]|uniref:hypothetical protein n=1 Tax=Paludisphaera rhizosphaerae TaxID=2711216 RepID=UPI0013EBB5F1|nr:hypothetical protein [Paludisphaera rhizosphaerae]
MARRMFAVLTSAVALIGCGESGTPRVALQPTSGKVTVDGQPTAGVEVRFRPADAPGSLDALVPFATTGDDGGFKLGTYEKGDGAPEGRYKVTLFWPDRPPGPQPAEDQLGGTYALAEKTPLEATVAKGENTIPTIEVPKSAVRTTKPGKPRRGTRGDSDGLE